MKKIKNTFAKLLLVAAILATSACNKDFFDQVPDDILTIEEIFNRRDLSEEWLAGVYNQIRDEAHRTNNTPWDVISDDADVSQRNTPFRVNLGNWNAASNYWNFWEHYYKGIRSATTFINNIDGNQQILLEREGEALIRQRKAEARFLRAFFYAELLKQYGPVILLGDEEIAPDLPTDDPVMQIPRSPFDVCVDYVVSELDLASQDLPVHYINQQDMVADFGRASQILCKAIKSRLLLYAASPLFNGNNDYAGFVNPDGTPLMNTTTTASKWQRAAAAAKEVIDYAESSGQLGLYKVIQNGEINAFQSYRDVFLDSWNIEWIMARNTNGLCSYQRSCTPRLASGYASMGPTQQLVDTYRMANGAIPVTGYNGNGEPIINTSSGYSETGFSSFRAPGATRSVNTHNMYINREPRFYATVTYSGSDWINTTSGLGAREIQLYLTGESGKGGSHDYSETGYLFRKNVSPTYDPRQTCAQRSYVMMRYAEVLLNYVEALNEYDAGNPDVLKYLNQIRERGGIPALASDPGQSEMRQEIRRERRIELTMEHLRYFDTRRWKIAEQTDAGPFYGMNVDGGTSNSDPNFFQRTAFESRVFRKAFYLFPIPQREVERNPNCVQNPGW
ncbi:RagB/SusD family nutrient uptake outer membrane protein [Sphingobacterium haloxyli]|uniref:RagB/SusD family nutrient uptake outer membrane protein n=1 Tax=Sphingobacterium haloxyli TaxID=2100533 RepID=A0A2S9J4H9_9SPHI|nr:RagB/SusD family nutrient uptake outer membrane protein [Sphingobacterium haloxyli]PRD47664.1 RagB/SusD family nutrient uptake outer membrane protein [Sphingobacterium haloxyli]